MSAPAAESPQIISVTTVLSLLSTVAILASAYLTSLRLLPTSSSLQLRILFIWHAFDALIHFILEGSYLWNCFFSHIPSTTEVSHYLPPNVYFLGQKGYLFGAEYGTSPLSALWREYAKADKRWGGSDLGVISLELLTVFVAGPMAVWICHCLKKERADGCFWMIVLATGELYGGRSCVPVGQWQKLVLIECFPGFMTFAPEWLSGSPNLNTSNFMYTYVFRACFQRPVWLTRNSWVYLFFFNTIWVWIPLWILYACYGQITRSISRDQAGSNGGKRKAK